MRWDWVPFATPQEVVFQMLEIDHPVSRYHGWAIAWRADFKDLNRELYYYPKVEKVSYLMDDGKEIHNYQYLEWLK